MAGGASGRRLLAPSLPRRLAAARRSGAAHCGTHLPSKSSLCWLHRNGLPSPLLQAASPTPIFGASSTFGGTGFGGFSGVAAKAAAGGEDAGAGGEEGGDEEAAPEEECKAEFQPVVQLEEVEVSTGEEEEEALFDA